MKRLMSGGAMLAVIAACSTAAVAAPPPEDETAKAGILAGLGLTVSGGKTTLANEAGAIEAGVIGADAFQQAGRVIAGIVNGFAGNARSPQDPKAPQRVVVLAHDEALALSQPAMVRQRIAAVRSLYQGLSCPTKPPKAGSGSARLPFADGAMPLLKDVIGAVATDISISGIGLTADDRMLIDAVLMHGATERFDGTATWTPVPSTSNSPAVSVSYVVPGEAVGAFHEGDVGREYRGLLHEQERYRANGCAGTAVVAAMSATDALSASLNAPGDKGAPSALMAALQLQEIGKGDPLVLRLAIEQVGGTSITRSGVLYTLGFPGAAMITSGLVVSFRLTYPKTGAVAAVGVVRCALKPSNLRKAHETVLKNSGDVACSYRASVGAVPAA